MKTKMTLSEIKDSIEVFYHEFYNDKDALTHNQAAELVADFEVRAFEFEDRVGVAMWDSSVSNEELLEVKLFNNKADAEKYFDELVEAELKKNSYLILFDSRIKKGNDFIIAPNTLIEADLPMEELAVLVKMLILDDSIDLTAELLANSFKDTTVEDIEKIWGELERKGYFKCEILEDGSTHYHVSYLPNLN